METPNRRHRARLVGAVVALLGAGVIAATIVGGWGHPPYALGVAALAIGVVIVVVAVVRKRIAAVVVGVVLAVAIVAVGALALTGPPRSVARWEGEADGPGGRSATVDGLSIAGGTARDLRTGEVVWESDESGAEPSLVSSDVVVLGTDDGSLGIETETGRELWRSDVTGHGIAHDGRVLVVAHPVSDATEAVALDLATGETVWREPGRPVMECDLGPADRFSPAWEQSHVLLIPDEERSSQGRLLDLTDGGVSVADVSCDLLARVLGDVLLESVDDTLVGRSVSDGAQLWATPVARPWSVEGAGSTVFTPTDRSDESSTDLTAIDVATGEARAVDPPPGEVESLSVLEVRRVPEVWLVVDRGSTVALWNPGSDEVVEVPGAASLVAEGIDASSGWMALSGWTRDLAGEETRQCWAFSPSGQLHGPVPGRTCTVDRDLLGTGDGVYPLG